MKFKFGGLVNILNVKIISFVKDLVLLLIVDDKRKFEFVKNINELTGVAVKVKFINSRGVLEEMLFKRIKFDDIIILLSDKSKNYI